MSSIASGGDKDDFLSSPLPELEEIESTNLWAAAGVSKNAPGAQGTEEDYQVTGKRKEPCTPESASKFLLDESEGSQGEDELYPDPIKDLYDCVKVRVDVHLIRSLSNAVRNVDKNHVQVQRFKRMFLRNLYGDTNQYLSVFIPDLTAEECRTLVELARKGAESTLLDIHDIPEGNDDLSNKMGRCVIYFVDGMHRAVALCDAEVFRK